MAHRWQRLGHRLWFWGWGNSGGRHCRRWVFQRHWELLFKGCGAIVVDGTRGHSCVFFSPVLSLTVHSITVGCRNGAQLHIGFPLAR